MTIVLLTAGAMTAAAQNPFSDEPIQNVPSVSQPTTGSTTTTTPARPNSQTTTGNMGLVFKYDNMYFKILTEKTVEVTGEVRGKYEGRVEIPNTVKHDGKTYQVVAIGQWAFHTYSKMTALVIPKSIQLIKTNAFFMVGLTEVVIPGDKVKVQKSAFLACDKLHVVTLNGKKQQCSANAFTRCTNVKELRIRGISESNNGKKLNTGTKNAPHYAVIKVLR